MRRLVLALIVSGGALGLFQSPASAGEGVHCQASYQGPYVNGTGVYTGSGSASCTVVR